MESNGRSNTKLTKTNEVDLVIEIEKKFLLTPVQQSALLDGATLLSEKLVTDSYFDTAEYRLTVNDLWFRERDGEYELKKPLQSTAGAATNRYHELTDRREIAQALEINDSVSLEDAMKAAGIERFITCYTQRKSYEKQGFHIDIDSVTFRDSSFQYAIAEIELLIDDEASADTAEAQIIKFAQQFDLITDQVILGKVIAYVQLERPEHYSALVAAKVLS